MIGPVNVSSVDPAADTYFHRSTGWTASAQVCTSGQPPAFNGRKPWSIGVVASSL